ncbi:MAG: C40 family peptidase [Spirochaetaceae bacterium]|jgi:cell wall-associated NlpC family hydrolase|nr:C40 family peptidase [Spirochaetaceae bacterium]
MKKLWIFSLVFFFSYSLRAQEGPPDSAGGAGGRSAAEVPAAGRSAGPAPDSPADPFDPAVDPAVDPAANPAANPAAIAATSAEKELPELDIEVLLRRRITEMAQEYLGVPYKYAGITPEGFDCTGLVYFVYREAAGMEVSRSSVGIWNSGKKIPLAQVQPGDVLVFTTIRPGASHAGIVLENGSRGILFIHAASQGSKTGVIISNLNENYYKARVMGARSYF